MELNAGDAPDMFADPMDTVGTFGLAVFSLDVNKGCLVGAKGSPAVVGCCVGTKACWTGAVFAA